jgi:hypothetical protein
MAEFRAEGRGSADDISSIGADLRRSWGVWDGEAGFAGYGGVLEDETDGHRRYWVPTN